MPTRNVTRPSAVSVYTDLAREFPGFAGATSAESNAIGE
jgi:hypothetical protein